MVAAVWHAELRIVLLLPCRYSCDWAALSNCVISPGGEHKAHKAEITTLQNPSAHAPALQYQLPVRENWGLFMGFMSIKIFFKKENRQEIVFNHLQNDKNVSVMFLCEFQSMFGSPQHVDLEGRFTVRFFRRRANTRLTDPISPQLRRGWASILSFLPLQECRIRRTSATTRWSANIRIRYSASFRTRMECDFCWLWSKYKWGKLCFVSILITSCPTFVLLWFPDHRFMGPCVLWLQDSLWSLLYNYYLCNSSICLKAQCDWVVMGAFCLNKWWILQPAHLHLIF